MGMYTELVVACRLSGAMPAEKLLLLKRLIHERDAIEALEVSGLKVPFSIGGSASFPCLHAELGFDDFYQDHVLDMRISRKNRGEFEWFLRWLRPHVVAGSGSHDLWASTHYEEDRLPTLYFLDEDDR